MPDADPKDDRITALETALNNVIQVAKTYVRAHANSCIDPMMGLDVETIKEAEKVLHPLREVTPT